MLKEVSGSVDVAASLAELERAPERVRSRGERIALPERLLEGVKSQLARTTVVGQCEGQQCEQGEARLRLSGALGGEGCFLGLPCAGGEERSGGEGPRLGRGGRLSLADEREALGPERWRLCEARSERFCGGARLTKQEFIARESCLGGEGRQRCSAHDQPALLRRISRSAPRAKRTPEARSSCLSGPLSGRRCWTWASAPA